MPSKTRVVTSIEEFEREFLPDPELTPEEKFKRDLQRILDDFGKAIERTRDHA